jgi:hypothetical protein
MGDNMGLPRAFVGFSSTDLHYYRLMQAWKASEHIDFNFADCQLAQEVRSEDETYIKRVCRERLDMAGYFIQLLGDDTARKWKYVKWEAEVARENECTIIGVNLNGSRQYDEARTPAPIRNVGALFISFNASIIAHALTHYQMKSDNNYYYKDEIYQNVGL